MDAPTLAPELTADPAPPATTLRRIQPIGIDAVEPGMAAVPEPTFEWVDPCELMVDDAYQRALGEAGLTLVRRIVSNWDWRRYKPPVVARLDGGGLRVMDGQHTATAAASHPDIDKIPVMVVQAETTREQAAAFVGQNTDRVNLTKSQLHFSAMAAGDETALKVQALCDRAGVRILRGPPAGNQYKARETVSVTGLAKLVRLYDAEMADRILGVLAQADMAPVSDAGLKAVELLLTGAEYKDLVEPEALTEVLVAEGQKGIEREAKLFSATHGIQIWKALAIVLFKKAKRGRRRAAA